MPTSALPAYPHMPAAQQLPSNGATFSVHMAGAGLPVVLLHGFPELAYSWRHQIDPLVQAGCQVITPDLRGYGHTGPQGALRDYRMQNLALDVIGILDALGIAEAVVVGHDFGGALAWSLARDHATRVSGVVSLNTPYTRRTQTDLITTLRQHRGDTHYMVVFQEPGVGERLLGEDVAHTFASLMRRPGPVQRHFAQAPPALQALPASLLGPQSPLGGEPLLDAESLAVFTAAYRHTGFTGGLNWYRNLHQNWLDTAGTLDQVLQPALMLVTEHDVFLPPKTADGMARNVPRVQTQMVRDCGHWTQQERPDVVNASVLGWLRQQGFLPAA